MTSAADLASLQEIDLRRDARRSLIADIESRLMESEELLAARELVQNAETAIAELRRQQRDLEPRISDLDAKLQPLETRLYDGSVRNPRELTDLQKEIDSLKAHRSQLDDGGLSLLEQIEAAQGELASSQEALRQAEAYWQGEQEELRQDLARAQAEAAVLQTERDQRTQGMDKSTMGLYESLRVAKQGRAVAQVERGACQGCRLSLPTHLVQRVRIGGVLVQCPSCNRILVGS